jgi:holliday junction DNA helicase RuvA
MIGKLVGTIDSRLEGSLLIDVHGVGYLVATPESLLREVVEGQNICLFIEPVFKQEMIVLYGFLSMDEKICFQKLTSVQGVGGKSGLSILSVLSVDDIIHAINIKDIDAFCRADGVGPKVSTRIVNELKSFSAKFHPVLPSMTKISPQTQQRDAIALLVQLGYRQVESTKVVLEITQESSDLRTEAIIPEALKRLSNKT